MDGRVLKVLSGELTSDLLLQAQDDVDGLVQDQQFGLWLVVLQVNLTHAAELLKRLVDVAHTEPLAGVIRHPPLAFPLGLLLRTHILVLMNTAAAVNKHTHTHTLSMEVLFLFIFYTGI